MAWAGRLATAGREPRIEGTLIAESIRVGAGLHGVPPRYPENQPLGCRRRFRWAAELWTLIEFEAEEPDAGLLAGALAKVLDRQYGWYTDFRTPDETFVVYSGRVFRYPRGDSPGRAEARAYGRSVGVPDHQLDWPV